MTNSNNNTSDIPGVKELHYSVNIGDHLHSKMDTHIRLMKKLADRSCTKQRWILDAIKEKLDNENHNGMESISKEKYFHVKVLPQINEKIERKVELIKNFRKSYSKKQLFIEAISEKLEREEQLAKELFEKAKSKHLQSKENLKN